MLVTHEVPPTPLRPWQRCGQLTSVDACPCVSPPSDFSLAVILPFSPSRFLILYSRFLQHHSTPHHV